MNNKSFFLLLGLFSSVCMDSFAMGCLPLPDMAGMERQRMIKGPAPTLRWITARAVADLLPHDEIFDEEAEELFAENPFADDIVEEEDEEFEEEEDEEFEEEEDEEFEEEDSVDDMQVEFADDIVAEEAEELFAENPFADDIVEEEAEGSEEEDSVDDMQVVVADASRFAQRVSKVEAQLREMLKETDWVQKAESSADDFNLVLPRPIIELIALVKEVEGNPRDALFYVCGRPDPLRPDCFFVPEILKCGVGIELKKAGKTPLLTAALSGNEVAFRELLAQGADVHTLSNWSNRTVLMCAVLGNCVEIVRCALDKGISISQIDRLGDTALMLAQFVQQNGFEEESVLERNREIIGLLQEA